MATTARQYEEKYKAIKTILVSQPKPEKSPYYNLQEKYGLKIDWRPFIYVEGLTEREFRKQRVYPSDFTAIIFSSKNAVDHFFRLCEDMRMTMPMSQRYFCTTEAIANYLQKFIDYRKRKVFAGHRELKDIDRYFTKFKAETFFLPISNLGSKKVIEYLDQKKVNYKKAVMYRTVTSDLSDLSDVKYDVLVFFSPLGISSLFANFPDFVQGDTRIAVFGNQTAKAAEEHGLYINIKAPSPEAPSMTMALENYLKISNKK